MIKQIDYFDTNPCNCSDPVRFVYFTDRSQGWCRLLGNPDAGNLVYLTERAIILVDGPKCGCNVDLYYNYEITKL